MGDWTIYPAGRSALQWSRVASTAVSWTASDLDFVVHWDDAAGPLNNWTPYSDSGVLAPSGPAGSDFLLLQNESAGARTDFLSILYADWPHAESTDWGTFGGADDGGVAAWTDTNGAAMGAGTRETTNFVTYFKPTSFPNNGDSQVTSRRNDYRGPDTLTVGPGSVWHDSSENTAADDFNESEAVYPLDFDMAGGLSVDLDGATTTRYHPFFKIRQWRSLQEPATVLVEGVAKTNDVDYRSDVKPVARAHFAQDLKWHSTLESAAALETTPDVGGAGSGSACGTAITYGPGRYGNGAVVGPDDQCVWFPLAGHFDPAQGALEFWFRPTYNSNDGVAHNIGGNFFNGANQVLFQKRSNDSLYFEITAGASVSSISVSSAQYSWRAGDWVHLRFEWDETEPVATQLRILVNGVEPNPGGGTGADYIAANLWLSANIFVGDRGTGNGSPGVYDEIHMYGGSDTTPTALAHGGLTSNASEYLADASRNYTFAFAAVDAERRGEYVYFGTDAKFRGLNVVMATPGAGTAPNLQWHFWNGTAWADLETGIGFTDQTNNLTRSGTIYWTAEPSGWSPYSVNGGPDLYYVRAYLASGDYGTQSPVERLVKTEILLFQYCGDVALDAQTFVFTPPAPTAVDLASFDARGLDEAVELTWETATELDNLGFHVHRAPSAEGPYQRITAALIPGLGSSPSGARYRYLDPGRVNGTTYFYKLEDVETTGKTEFHGPVSATPTASAQAPKSPASSPELTYGDPSSTALRIVERTARHMVLELTTGGFSAEPQQDGSVRLSIPGYSDENEPGSPAIPVKRSWIAVESGRGVRIAWVRAEQVEAFSLRPMPGDAPVVRASRRGTVTAGRRGERPGAAFRAPGLYPEEEARLVSVGYQGEAKKALFELAPLRWDRSGGQLLLARKLTVRLVFDGREAGRHRETEVHNKRAVTRRLSVRERGLYGVSFEQVFGGRRRALLAASLRLSRQGEEVAFHLEPDHGRFGPGSTLYFISEGESLNPYGREAVYELELGGAGLRMPRAASAPAGSPTSFYWRKLAREENRYYQAGLLEARDRWLWDLLFAPVSRGYRFELSEVAPTTEPSRLEVWLQGVSDLPSAPDHHLRIFVNGSLAAESNLEGKEPLKLEAEIRAGVLREGENLLEIQNVGDTNAPYSMVMLDRFELLYPRRLVAENGRLEGRFSEAGVADVEGIAASAIIVDVTEEPPRWLAGADATASGLRFEAEAGRSYLLVSREAVLKPEVRATPAGRLKSTFHQADYLVIGPSELLEAAQPLLELRRESGLRAVGVSIEDVYSEFGYGESRPEALREFLAFAYHHWRRPAPRYALLLGDATYDFKDNLQTGVKNQVPPLLVKTSYLWTASDPAYAAVNGEDILPDLAIGRLPVATAEETRALVQKIRAYEESSRIFAGPAAVVADNADAAGDFEADAEEIASGVLSSRSPERIYLGRLGAESTRKQIQEAFDRGAGLVSYLGHGGIHLWASENVFNTGDVSGLAPQTQQPLVLTLNCLNGYFHFPYFNSLAEELLKTNGKGAIAAFSPSGLSLHPPAHLFHKLLLRELVSGNHARLGDAVLAAQAAYAESGEFPELLTIYHLLGDPALRLQ